MSLECAFHLESELLGRGITSLIIGRVLSAAVDEDYLNGGRKYGQDGFMYYLYDLQDFAKGDQGERQVASLNVLRKA